MRVVRLNFLLIQSACSQLMRKDSLLLIITFYSLCHSIKTALRVTLPTPPFLCLRPAVWGQLCSGHPRDPFRNSALLHYFTKVLAVEQYFCQVVNANLGIKKTLNHKMFQNCSILLAFCSENPATLCVSPCLHRPSPQNQSRCYRWWGFSTFVWKYLVEVHSIILFGLRHLVSTVCYNFFF